MATRAYNYANLIDISLNSFSQNIYNYIGNNIKLIIDGSSNLLVSSIGLGSIDPSMGIIYKNNTISINNHIYRTIEINLGFSGGMDGSGEYIFSLPEHIYFNIEKNPIYTDILWKPNVGSMINYFIPANGTIVEQNEWSITNYIVPYSNNSYRIVSSSTSLMDFTTLSSAYYGYSKSIMISLKFNIYI